MEMVDLKNGSQVPDVLVMETMKSLQLLADTDLIALHELREICRNCAHQPLGSTGDMLKRLSLLDANGKVHDSIRSIILSGVFGEGLNLHLTSPVKS